MSDVRDHDLERDEPPSDDLRAAEYVLGTMDAAGRDAFAARIARDPDLARAIDAWRGRLSPLADEIVPVVPPMHVWHGVRARVGLDTQAAPSTGRAPLWERLAFWRGVGFAGFAATAACVIALVALRPAPLPVAPEAHSALPHPVRLVATMADGKGRATYMAAIDDDACTVVLMPLDRDRIPGQVPQLWLVAADGTPRSMGVGTGAPMQAMTVPRDLRAIVQPSDMLSVSMEPPGGSPTGRPTGFVVGTGRLTRL